MKILQVRLGHATNSSSTHSIIIAGTAQGDGGFERSGRSSSPLDPYDNQFGRQDFVARTKKHKTNYFAQQLYDSLKLSVGEVMAGRTCTDLFEGLFHDPEGYVDHESRMGLVRSIHTGEPDVYFHAALSKAVIDHPGVEVMGGGEGSLVGTSAGALDSAFDWLRMSRDLFTRHDGSVWTLFNRGTGAKLVLDLSTHENLSDYEVSKAFRPCLPELVDIKVTDKCVAGCSYCYMNSTPDGDEPSFEKLKPYFRSLKGKVFEVALGGGEPTDHPEFYKILRYLSRCVPSVAFTTKSLRWYKNFKTIGAVRRYVSAYAHSVDDAKEMREVWTVASRAFESFHLPGTYVSFPSVNIQYILDAHLLDTLYRILDSYLDCEPYTKKENVRIPGNLVLLGYKSSGRGGQAPYHNRGWLQGVLDYYRKAERERKWGLPSLGIDTLLARQYLDELKAAKISTSLYYLDEGKYSMYIDAVRDTFAPSSYERVHEQSIEGMPLDQMFHRVARTGHGRIDV